MSLEGKIAKKERFIRSSIEVKLSPIHRYGVFATRDFSPDEIIEECPVIVYRLMDTNTRPDLFDRGFYWDKENCAVSLGYGSLYNHASEANAKFIIDRNEEALRFIAAKPIRAGEEIFIYYGKEWFLDHSIKEESTDSQNKKNKYGLIKVLVLLTTLLLLSKMFPCQLFSSGAKPELHKEAARNIKT